MATYCHHIGGQRINSYIFSSMPSSGTFSALGSQTFDSDTSVGTVSGVFYDAADHLLVGACWNDFAEYRQCEDENVLAGNVVYENEDEILKVSTKRLQPVPHVVSDTFGFAIGKTDTATTPIASCGRVLAYTDKDRNTFKPGDVVCSGKNGTVSKMTVKEIKQYPQCVLGYVVSVPEYEFWEPKHIAVNNRIWIQVK